MNNILDTHTFIWFIEGDRHLSARARKYIEMDGAGNFLSIASLWEIAVKVSLEKIELKKPYAEISGQIDDNGFQILPITFRDTLILSKLPFHHRDPFDRIIISQSIAGNFNVITKDKSFDEYNLNIIW